VSSELASTFEQIKQQGTFIRAIKIQIQDGSFLFFPKDLKKFL